MSSDRLFTADEALALPGLKRHELIQGRIVEMDWSGAEHGGVASNVVGELRTHVRAHGLGRTFGAETGFQIAYDPDTVRAPDAAFVRAERADQVGRTNKAFPGPPDLAVEVVSPKDPAREVREKAFDWLGAGAQAVLVLEPRTRTATVYRSPTDIRSVTGDDVLASEPHTAERSGGGGARSAGGRGGRGWVATVSLRNAACRGCR